MRRLRNSPYAQDVQVCSSRMTIPWRRQLGASVAFGLTKEDEFHIGILLGEFDGPLTNTTPLVVSHDDRIIIPFVKEWQYDRELIAFNMFKYIELWRPDDLDKFKEKYPFAKLADDVINNNPNYNPFHI